MPTSNYPRTLGAGKTNNKERTGTVLKLMAENPEQADANLAVRWCISPEDLEELKRRGVTKPHLLLLITHEDREIDRQLIPLERMLHFVQFHRPGRHSLIATIVWAHDGSVKTLNENWIQRHQVYFHEHDYPSSDHPGLANDRWATTHSRLGNAELDVFVPDAFFAKRPKNWEWRWTNLWFETKPRDQCQFRRRRFLAYTIQPFVVLLFLIVTPVFRLLVATFLILLGMRQVHFGPILHPWNDDTEEIWSHVRDGNNIFFKDKNGNYRPLAINILFPPFIAICWLFASTIMMKSAPMEKITGLLGGLAIAIGFVTVLSVLIAMGVMLKKMLDTNSIGRDRERWQRKREREDALEAIRKRQLEEEYARFSTLTCSEGSKATLKNIPKANRTIHLRFQDLKAKVCRPFAS